MGWACFEASLHEAPQHEEEWKAQIILILRCEAKPSLEGRRTYPFAVLPFDVFSALAASTSALKAASSTASPS